MTLGLQPNMLERLVSNQELTGRGFAERLLYFIPEPLHHVNLIGLPDVPESYKQDFGRVIDSLAMLYRKKNEPHVIRLTDQARTLFENYRQELSELTDGKLGGSESIRAWTRKAHGKVARVAGLLALLENPGGVDMIEARYIKSAIDMFDKYFIPHMLVAFGGCSNLTEPEKSVLIAMQDPNVTREYNRKAFRLSDVRHKVSGQKQFRGEAGAKRFSAAIDKLSQTNRIALIPDEIVQGDKPQGRPAGPVYAIHKALLDGNDLPAIDDDIPF